MHENISDCTKNLLDFLACQKLRFCASAKPLSQEYAEKGKQLLQKTE